MACGIGMFSLVDAEAQKKWNAYTKARDETFARTDHPSAPWRIVESDTKKTARLEIIRDLLDSYDYKGKNTRITRPNRDVVFFFSPDGHKKLAR